jgi:hypothetical protein
MAVFTCPDCGHSQAVDDKHIGKTATCPQCKAQGTVSQALGSQAPSTYVGEADPSIRKGQGEPLGIGSLLRNKESSLKQEWVVIDDPRMTVRFIDVCGVTTKYDQSRSSEYSQFFLYTVQHQWMSGSTPLSAIEFRFLTFSVWGSHARTLCASNIKDIKPLTKYWEDSQWRLFSDHEAWEHFASIGYVARVRTAEGKVIEADTDLILREAKRFTEKFTEADLEPKAPKKDS